MTEYLLSKAAIRRNIAVVRSRFGDRVMAVIKCGGYGFGIPFLAGLVREGGISRFAVYDADELAELRQAGFSEETLVLSPVESEATALRILALDGTATVASREGAACFFAAAKACGLHGRAHLYINTGMGRGGYAPSDVAGMSEVFAYPPHICCTGIYTHFAAPLDARMARRQMASFLGAVSALRERGIDPGLVHAAGSAAAFHLPDCLLDCVRIGSALTGRVAGPADTGLVRAGYLQTEVGTVFRLRKGETVGYLGHFTARRELTAAVIPVGHYDGFGLAPAPDIAGGKACLRQIRQALSGFLRRRQPFAAEIGGRRFSTIGHICENNAVLDVTGAQVKPGDLCRIDISPLLVREHVRRRAVE